MNNRILYTPKNEIVHRRGRRGRRSFALAALFLALAGIAALIYILRFPYWQIKHIEITGSETLSEDDLRLTAEDELRGSRFYFVPRKAIFAVEGKELSAAITSKFPKIAELEVKKIFPDSLSLTVREREFFGIYCNDLNAATSTFTGEPDCVYLDQSGFAYEKAPAVTGFLIVKVSTDRGVLQIPSHLVEPELMERMRKISDAFAENSGVTIVGYNLLSKVPSEIRAVTREGFEIWLKSDDDFARAAQILKKVLEAEVKDRKPQLQYVDLRLGNKVFYK